MKSNRIIFFRNQFRPRSEIWNDNMYSIIIDVRSNLLGPVLPVAAPGPMNIHSSLLTSAIPKTDFA